MSQPIHFVELQRASMTVVRDDIFCLQPKRGWLWAQKLALWMLRKLGCQWNESVVKYERHVIDPGKFLDVLQRQQRGLLDHCHHQARHLLIGSDDFAELMCSDVLRHHHQFIAEYRHSDGVRGTMFGLKVTIVPWMTGFLVMPGDL